MAVLSKLKDLRVALAILYGIAMLLLPVAHLRMVMGGGDASAIEQAYPDGSLPILCLTGKSTPDKPAASNGCVACTMVAAPGLPLDGACDLPVPTADSTTTLSGLVVRANRIRLRWPPSQPRAPPTI